MSSGKKRRRHAAPIAAPPAIEPQSQWGWAPVLLAVSLFGVSLVPRVQSSVSLTWSFWAAAAGLLAWYAALAMQAPRDRWKMPVVTVLRPQHYLQALVQVTVFAYWGWYWRPVYDHAWLLVGQLLFAYAFGMLLARSRRDTYVLGFGPFPIIFSTNLFLWFRDDWFYLQFLMIAVGFLGKELVTWTRDGRRTHIFNPSAFSLGLFSVVLIATGTTDFTWGVDIATTLTLAPRIYLFLFLVGLVVMYFFSITLIAGSAAIVLFGASAAYSAIAGVPYFVDSEIPTAVFLGLHLLVTDPSTSPRTPLGKIVFGLLYGLGVFALYWLLGAVGAPTFYDKLLCVPLLNLSVQRIDRLVASRVAGASHPPVSLPAPLRSNLAHMGVWAVFFGAMTLLGGTDGRHRGDTVPFWEQACAEQRPHACERLLQVESSYCQDNSGWACNEMGAHYREGRIVEGDPEQALSYFSRACELRVQAACLNLLDPDGGTVARSTPRPLDLRLLLREAGPNLMDMTEPALYARACGHGWSFACDESSR